MSCAVKDYMKRFSIEFTFKNQKTNGQFLEETQIKDLYTFGNLYACLCFSQSLLTILGIDYSKNLNCYKKTDKLSTFDFDIFISFYINIYNV